MLASTAAATGGAELLSASPPAARPRFAHVAAPLDPDGHDPVTVRRLDGAAPQEVSGGTTWGVPWPRGAFSPTGVPP